MNPTLAMQHLSPEAAQQLLQQVPDYVKGAMQKKAVEMECSVEAIVEMALASFLDEEAFSFEDCLLAERLNDVA